MLLKLLPILLVLVGAGAGLAGGMFLRPTAPEPEAAAEPETAEPAAAAAEGQSAEQNEELHDYARFSNQFIVPIMSNGRVASLVVLSLSLEVKAGQMQQFYEMEPKLRDALLHVLFDHANNGGFNGSFTDAANLVFLRQALREAAQRVFGKSATDVLIVDIVRQDN
jgi:hypothetical protein